MYRTIELMRLKTLPVFVALATVALLAVPSTGIAQQSEKPLPLSSDTPGRPPSFMPSQHYLVRVVLFSQDPRQGGVVFLGDSLTEGWIVYDRFEKEGWRNRGIGGDTTFGVLVRLHEIILEKPDKVFIMIGVNDLIKDERHGLIQRYEYIVETLKQALPKAEIYIQSVLPVNWEDFPRATEYVDNEKIAKVNERLKKLAEHEGVEFLNLAPRFADRKGNLRKELSLDGLHINIEGYELWYSLIEDKI